MSSRGRVRVWHAQEGWGVIDSDKTPGGCWTHFSAVLVEGYRGLEAGQEVKFEFEAPGQDGYPFRALAAWPAGDEPVHAQMTEDPSGAFASSLTLTFGDESEAPSVDRWSRSDWWGVVLDTDDVATLARFYSELRGWPIWRMDETGAALDLGEGVAYLSIQHNSAYVRPVWPAGPDDQQMMLHLDFQVTDLEAETARAVELGAELPEHQPQDNVRVLLDPAGHPFCLYT